MKTLTAEQVATVIEALQIAAQNREDVGEPEVATKFDALREELAK
jgi:hypothetical protein